MTGFQLGSGRLEDLFDQLGRDEVVAGTGDDWSDATRRRRPGAAIGSTSAADHRAAGADLRQHVLIGLRIGEPTTIAR